MIESKRQALEALQVISDGLIYLSGRPDHVFQGEVATLRSSISLLDADAAPLAFMDPRPDCPRDGRFIAASEIEEEDNTDYYTVALFAGTPAAPGTPVVEDLAMMVRRLARAVRRHDPESALAASALALLDRKSLTSPFRDETETESAGAAQTEENHQ